MEGAATIPPQICFGAKDSGRGDDETPWYDIEGAQEAKGCYLKGPNLVGWAKGLVEKVRIGSLRINTCFLFFDFLLQLHDAI